MVMMWETGRLEKVKWQKRFLWFPQPYMLKDGTAWVHVWLRTIQWRDIDCVTEEIRLPDGRLAVNVHST